ncbi:hypothetical protein [Kitasatospora sp. NPDC001175]|uniref:hypothetical protein n=1 Tax=Kitasatospora sp. NPDC001175 TaxID=3157103 RepID=UPI003D034CB5
MGFVRVADVLSQPVELDFEHEGGGKSARPGLPGGTAGRRRRLFDVRPELLIEPRDALKFAAAQHVAEARGWQYSVVAGWRPHAHSVLDFLPSQHHPLQDPMQLQHQLLTAVGKAGEVTFGEAAEATSSPALPARQALRSGSPSAAPVLTTG